MPLDNRNLETGTVLHSRYKGKDRTCEVIRTVEGLRYRLDDGREFASPSSAGKAAMGGVSCNGWRFWSTEAVPARRGRRPKGTSNLGSMAPAQKTVVNKGGKVKKGAKAIRAAAKRATPHMPAASAARTSRR
jgi:hypothetical protein